VFCRAELRLFAEPVLTGGDAAVRDVATTLAFPATPRVASLAWFTSATWYRRLDDTRCALSAHGNVAA
jgi:hypothetical protein